MSTPRTDAVILKIANSRPSSLQPIFDLAAARAENEEQARLLGMSAERECDLRGKVDRLERDLAAARIKEPK